MFEIYICMNENTICNACVTKLPFGISARVRILSPS
jgi:hypothetical protein